MNPKLYIETSIISYLTARPSRDLIIAANQQITLDWWEYCRIKFNLYASQLVLTEAGKGDQQAANKRLEILQDIKMLELKAEATDLAKLFIRHKVLPPKAGEDALHIAIATIYGLDYLMTWNCKHIANATIQKQIKNICVGEGYEMPIICTPQNLWENKNVERPNY